MNQKNLVGLFVAGATLASSAVVFSANPAQAASLTYNWSFSGMANTGGTFVADDATGLLSSIAGTVGGSNITSLASVGAFVVDGHLGGNDNLIPLTSNGISFLTAEAA